MSKKLSDMFKGFEKDKTDFDSTIKASDVNYKIHNWINNLRLSVIDLDNQKSLFNRLEEKVKELTKDMDETYSRIIMNDAVDMLTLRFADLSLKEEIEPKKELSIHEGKFVGDKKLDKVGLMSKIIEIMQIHLKQIPTDWLRGQLLNFDLISHRKQLKNKGLKD